MVKTNEPSQKWQQNPSVHVTWSGKVHFENKNVQKAWKKVSEYDQEIPQSQTAD